MSILDTETRQAVNALLDGYERQDGEVSRLSAEIKSAMHVLVNESTTVRLSGAVIEVFFHGERIHAEAMTASADEYSIGYLRRMALKYEYAHRERMADEEIERLTKEMESLKAKQPAPERRCERT